MRRQKQNKKEPSTHQHFADFLFQQIYIYRYIVEKNNMTTPPQDSQRVVSFKPFTGLAQAPPFDGAGVIPTIVCF